MAKQLDETDEILLKAFQKIGDQIDRCATAFELIAERMSPVAIDKSDTLMTQIPLEPGAGVSIPAHETPKEKKPRAKKEKPEVETFPEAPAAAPELTIADLDLGQPAKKEEIKELGSAYTVIDVKAELTKLKAAKGPSAIASLFADFGLKHVNDIKPEQIPALMDAVKRAQA